MVKIGLEFNIYIMKNIKNFDKFNEGLFSNIKSVFSSDRKVKRLNSLYDKQLDMYELMTIVKNDGQEVDINHKGRLVGKLSAIPSQGANWSLTLYYYESEIPSDGKGYKKPEEIQGQKEQPYAIGNMKFENSDKAILTLCRWWETTKSGFSKNPDNKVRIR